MEYLLTEDTILYKGVRHNDLENKINESCWFALDLHVAQGYAKTFADEETKTGPPEVYSFTLNKPLKLININSMHFRTDFWDKCNTQLEHQDIAKLSAFVAIGLLALEDQETYVRPTHCDPQLKAQGNMLGGHRCSAPDIDRHFVKLLTQFYKDWDGYIIPKDIPTCYHGIFNREVCIFNIKPFIKTVKKEPLSGGVYTLKKPKPWPKSLVIDENLIAREKMTHEDWEKSRRLIERSIRRGKKALEVTKTSMPTKIKLNARC